MDRRLNLFFENIRDKAESEGNGKVYVIRDAGGGIEAVKNTIADLSITDIHDYTHTNCGAMGVALAACSKVHTGAKLDEVESSEDVYRTTVEPFLGGAYETPLAIEQKNTSVQMEALSRMKTAHPELKTSCELIEVEKLGVPKTDGEHTLVIGMAFSGKYSDIARRYGLELHMAYFVQANHIEEIRPPVRLAVEKLGIKNVMFISNERSEDDTINNWVADGELGKVFGHQHVQVHKP